MLNNEQKVQESALGGIKVKSMDESLAQGNINDRIIK
jgi:hypothetical protein